MASEPEPTAPTPEQLVNAIALLCAREGILPPPEQPNALGQVTSLLTRAMKADELAARYLRQFQESRQACYAISQQAAVTAPVEQDVTGSHT